MRARSVVLALVLACAACAGDALTAPAALAPALSGVVDVLAGRTEGVAITRAPAAPGAYITIRCGGAAGPHPVYIVDGVVLAAPYADALSRLGANEIVSVEVMKGPTAAGRYGPGARDGVVILRTRRAAAPHAGP